MAIERRLIALGPAVRVFGDGRALRAVHPTRREALMRAFKYRIWFNGITPDFFVL